MEDAKIKRRCVIIGGGEMACPKKMLGEITEEDFVIAADSGYRYTLEAEVRVDLFVGDFDSFDGTVESWVPVMSLPTHKDVTDTHAAVLEGLKFGYRDFVIFGALGGRFDHSFANLSLLNLLLDRGSKGRIVYDNGSIFMLRDGTAELNRFDGYLSVFPFGGPASGVTLEGVEYPLQDAALSADNPVGISNHITALRGRVRVKSGTLVIMQVRE